MQNPIDPKTGCKIDIEGDPKARRNYYRSRDRQKPCEAKPTDYSPAPGLVMYSNGTIRKSHKV